MVKIDPISPAVSKVKLSDRMNERRPLIGTSSGEDKLACWLLGSMASDKFVSSEPVPAHDVVNINKRNNVVKRIVAAFKIRLSLRLCAT